MPLLPAITALLALLQVRWGYDMPALDARVAEVAAALPGARERICAKFNCRDEFDTKLFLAYKSHFAAGIFALHEAHGALVRECHRGAESEAMDDCAGDPFVASESVLFAREFSLSHELGRERFQQMIAAAHAHELAIEQLSVAKQRLVKFLETASEVARHFGLE